MPAPVHESHKLSDGLNRRKANQTRVAKPKSNCAVYQCMEMTLSNQTRSDMDAADDAPDIDGAPAAPADLYDMLGYRGTGSTVTTQQWLAMRCISL